MNEVNAGLIVTSIIAACAVVILFQLNEILKKRIKIREADAEDERKAEERAAQPLTEFTVRMPNTEPFTVKAHNYTTRFTQDGGVQYSVFKRADKTIASIYGHINRIEEVLKEKPNDRNAECNCEQGESPCESKRESEEA